MDCEKHRAQFSGFSGALCHHRGGVTWLFSEIDEMSI